MNDNMLAYMLLELAKDNEYSNDEIKNIDFTDVIGVNVYNNTTNRNDDTTIYCVYADCVDLRHDNEYTAEFYFVANMCTVYSKCYHLKDLEVHYLYAVNQH